MKSLLYTMINGVLSLFVMLHCIACSDDNEVGTGKYPVPTIEEFYPTEGLPSSVVTIKGTNFGNERTERVGRVYFGGVEATEYVSWSDTELKVRVPNAGVSGNITLWVWKNHTDSNEKFTCVPGAVIQSLSPEISFPGSTITITGKNFGYFLEKGLTAANVEVLFQAEEGTTSVRATSFTEKEIMAEIPADARGGIVTVKFGDLQIVDGPSLTLVGDMLIDMMTFEAIYDAHNKVATNEMNMISVWDDGVAHIENTKSGSYAIWKVTAPATGLFEPYVLAGTPKDGSYLNIDMGTDLIDLKNKMVDQSLTKVFIKGNWNDKTKHTFGPFLLREGNTYYLKLTFLQDGTTWVGNAHELGMNLAADQTQSGIIVDNNTSLGYRLYENDFNSGKFKVPFYDAWAESPNYIKVENQYCEFYFNQAALDANPDRRMLKGAELSCDYRTTTAGWYGFKIYLPENKFPKDIDGSIIAQIFNQGDRNSWAGHLSVNHDKLVLSHRYALVEPTEGVVGTLEWDKWIPVVLYFKVGKNGKGRLKAWMGKDMQEGSPAYDSGNCDFGFGNWIDDDTLDGEVSESNPIADAIGAKFGLYVSTGGDRIIRFDDVKLLEGNPTGAFNIVKP